MNATGRIDTIYETEVVEGVVLVRLRTNALNIITDPLRFPQFYNEIESLNDASELCGYALINDIGYDGPASIATLLEEISQDEQALIRAGRQVLPAYELITARFRSSVGRYLLSVMALEKPSIAGVQGAQSGEYLGVSLAFDMRVATRDTSFAFDNVRTGLPPSPALTHLMPRYIGIGRTMSLLQDGATIDAQEAHALGLITHLVDNPGELPSECLKGIHALEANYRNVLAFQRKQILPSFEEMQSALTQWYKAMVKSVNDLRKGGA